MAQAETWAREWYEKRRRTRKAEARLERIHRRLEARADAFAFELSEDVRQYRHRRAAALKVGGGDNIAAQVSNDPAAPVATQVLANAAAAQLQYNAIGARLGQASSRGAMTYASDCATGAYQRDVTIDKGFV